MNSDVTGYAVPVARHPVFNLLVAFPIACFTAALLTDAAYAQTANMLWADFSAWALALGLVMGVLAAIAGLVGLIANRRLSRPHPVLPLVLGGLVTLVLAAVNNMVHSRDAWTSVVPYGLLLSALTVVVMIVTAWLGAPRVVRTVPVVRYEGVRP